MVLWAGLLIPGIGCGSIPNPNLVSPFSTKLSPYNYKEEGQLVFLNVGVEAARFVEEEKYFPLFIALANKGVPTLVINRESFTFEDSFSRRYSPLPVSVIQTEYRRQQFDLRLFRQNLSFTGTSTDRYNMFRSNFYPSVKPGVINDRIPLPRFGYLNDILYFPVPEEGIHGGPFRLYFKTSELEESVVVVFEIPE